MLAALQQVMPSFAAPRESARETEAPKLFLSTHPPSMDESEALAQGLMLEGEPLLPPRFVDMGWREGQKFEESDDPDRMRQNWAPPRFLAVKAPQAQRERTRVEELPLPSKQVRAGSFARIVHGVLDESDCRELIRSINEKGFTPALLNIGRGRQQLSPFVRNGHRAIVDCAELSEWLLEVLRPHLPEECAGGRLVDLNERCRILCYTPGQEFATHFDGCYTRPRGSAKAGDCSRVTVQLYLHDVPEGSGGETTFHFRGQDSLPCQPKAGAALLFTQDLEHEGSLLRKGLKYTLRTEAMYGRRPDSK